MQNSIINTHIYTYTCIPYHLPKLKNYSLTFLENADANTIIYSIIDDNIKISAIFEHLQDQRKTFLAEWSLQQTTLESVFLRIALEAEEKEGEGEDGESV